MQSQTEETQPAQQQAVVHTPGPWFVEWDGTLTYRPKHGGCSPVPNIDANRRLKAAAPVMLAALQRQHVNILSWLETGEPAGPEESKSIADEIEAAIIAATAVV